jgi:molybdopterin molybdotransferase
MLSVAEAQGVVLQHSRPLVAETLSLGPELLGQVLAEDVASDLDMPPYDKALMDGYAVRSADLPDGHGKLAVIEEVMAGRVPQRELGPGQATRIMTGAPLPVGADAVVIVERTRIAADGQVEIEDRPPKPGMNMLYRAREMRRGETVLTSGTVLGPAEFGLLATVGRTSARVHRRPTVAVLSTGDEVVDAGQTPGPGQIRNSNSPTLRAQAQRAGAVPRDLGIARDRIDSLSPLIRQGLQADVLILSGGVSAGKLDLVPGVLQELGVTAQFHKVAMKPGKPVYFGTCGDTLVFGLPGNPVSALVCFELFVRPTLRRLLGHTNALPQPLPLPLAADLTHRSDRPTYFPARRELCETGWRVRPVQWLGSTDLRSLCGTDALLVLPAGSLELQAGQACSVLLCD